MSNFDYENTWGKWRNLIGDFMMEFSEIEYISFSLWSSKVQQSSEEKPSYNFKARTKQVISKLNNRSYSEIRVLLERAIEIADKRNTIAHNPTLLQVFSSHDSSELHHAFGISTYVEGDCIDLACLEELVAEVRDIKTQIYMRLGYLPHEDSNG